MIPGVTIALRREPGNEDIAIPAYMTPGAAGADICAAVREAVVLPPGGRALIPSGFAFDVPDGFEVQIRPRSGLAIRHGIGLLNAPGTIDADYRGEVCCILINLGSEPYTVARGDRVAQMIVAPVVRAAFREVVELGPSGRGAGGFGSTGTRGT